MYDQHITDYVNNIFETVMAILGPDQALLGWADWSRYAAQGEW